MPPERSTKIYSATYSNVPVYEFNVAGNHIMRRRSDDWINATHILKVADHDKPARTRILEREVQKGVHEKVQGGYGKYQGTWIPLPEGRVLAERNGVLEKLLPILDFVPGDRSPPPAPKHATASSNKPKVPKQPSAARRATANVAPPRPSQTSDISYDAYSVQETPDRASIGSESDVDMRHPSQYTNNQSRNNNNRKRKRPQNEPEIMSYEDQQHLLWTDELLDYFMLSSSADSLPSPPEPPTTIDLNRPVDEKGHTPMHWAAAMADLNVVRDLLHRGARVDISASNGETPLMRAVLFTNNFDKQSMDRLVQVLQSTIHQKDWCLSTVFHHIVATTCSKSKYQCARYYLDTILDRVAGTYAPQQISHLLDQQDQNGDTAILIAARYGARKCVRSLLNRGASVTIPNQMGQTADELIQQLNARRRERYGLSNLNVTSSSPMRGVGDVNGSLYPHAMTANNHHHSSSTSAAHNALNNIAPSSATATPHSLRHLPNQAAKRHKTTIYQSEAAQLLTSQLPVLIASRTEALAAALESELREREGEVAEGERVLATRRNDLAELKGRSEALAAGERRDEADNEDEEAQKRELHALEAESRRLVEQEQARELIRLVSELQSREGPSSADDSAIAMVTNGNSGKFENDADASDKLRLAHALADQQTRHAQLLDDFVAAQATVSASSTASPMLSQRERNGLGNGNANAQKNDRHFLYKRLITAALAVPPEDVEALLPDMVRELEDARRERAIVGPGYGDTDADVGMFDGALAAGRGGPGSSYASGHGLSGAREAVRAAG